MANEETKEVDILKTPTNSPLIGHQAKPTVLDSTTKLDIDTAKSLVDNIIEAGLSHTLDVSAIESFTSISNARDQIYQLIDTMCQDSAVSSIVRTYAEDVCEAIRTAFAKSTVKNIVVAVPGNDHNAKIFRMSFL